MLSGPVNAVVTTGIYCRDGCPATPLPGNIRTFALDAAAEVSGFRPCLRCRPEQRAEPEHWATGQLVARGLDAICAGILDHHPEDELADACGVSVRHLRRLFVEQIGATPTQIAISRRAHFARRLLDETNLPIAQIAFAAGFGSLRTMNDTMRRIFQFTPTALRAKRTHHHRELADGGLHLTIALTSPVSPDWFSRMAAITIAGVERVDAGNYWRTVVLAGAPGVVRISLLDAETVSVEAHLPRLDRLIDLATDIKTMMARPGVPAWFETEASIKDLLTKTATDTDARAVLERLIHQQGTSLAKPLLGLAWLPVDYADLQVNDWLKAGAPQPTAAKCVAAIQSMPSPSTQQTHPRTTDGKTEQ